MQRPSIEFRTKTCLWEDMNEPDPIRPVRRWCWRDIRKDASSQIAESVSQQWCRWTGLFCTLIIGWYAWMTRRWTTFRTSSIVPRRTTLVAQTYPFTDLSSILWLDHVSEIIMSRMRDSSRLRLLVRQRCSIAARIWKRILPAMLRVAPDSFRRPLQLLWRRRLSDPFGN